LNRSALNWFLYYCSVFLNSETKDISEKEKKKRAMSFYSEEERSKKVHPSQNRAKRKRRIRF